jgi:hypothetical protein
MADREYTLHGASDTLMEVLAMTDRAIARGRSAVEIGRTPDAVALGWSAIELAQAVRDKILEAQDAIKLHELRVKHASDVLLYGGPTRDLARELARMDSEMR